MFEKLIGKLTQRAPSARIAILTEPTAIAVHGGSKRQLLALSFEEWARVAERYAEHPIAAQVARVREGHSRALVFVERAELAYQVDLTSAEEYARFGDLLLGDNRQDRALISTNDYFGDDDPTSTGRGNPSPPPPPKPTFLGKKQALVLARLEAVLRIVGLDIVVELEGAAHQR